MSDFPSLYTLPHPLGTQQGVIIIKWNPQVHKHPKVQRYIARLKFKCHGSSSTDHRKANCRDCVVSANASSEPAPPRIQQWWGPHPTWQNFPKPGPDFTDSRVAKEWSDGVTKITFNSPTSYSFQKGRGPLWSESTNPLEAFNTGPNFGRVQYFEFQAFIRFSLPECHLFVKILGKHLARWKTVALSLHIQSQGQSPPASLLTSLSCPRHHQVSVLTDLQFGCFPETQHVWMDIISESPHVSPWVGKDILESLSFIPLLSILSYSLLPARHPRHAQHKVCLSYELSLSAKDCISILEVQDLDQEHWDRDDLH